MIKTSNLRFNHEYLKVYKDLTISWEGRDRDIYHDMFLTALENKAPWVLENLKEACLMHYEEYIRSTEDHQTHLEYAYSQDPNYISEFSGLIPVQHTFWYSYITNIPFQQSLYQWAKSINLSIEKFQSFSDKCVKEKFSYLPYYQHHKRDHWLLEIAVHTLDMWFREKYLLAPLKMPMSIQSPAYNPEDVRVDISIETHFYPFIQTEADFRKKTISMFVEKLNQRIEEVKKIAQENKQVQGRTTSPIDISKRNLTHFEWLVLFEVDQYKQKDIAKIYDCEIETVRFALGKVRREIGLLPRPRGRRKLKKK